MLFLYQNTKRVDIPIVNWKYDTPASHKHGGKTQSDLAIYLSFTTHGSRLQHLGTKAYASSYFMNLKMVKSSKDEVQWPTYLL